MVGVANFFVSEVEIPIHEELEKVIPYQYSTPFTQQWNATDIHVKIIWFAHVLYGRSSTNSQRRL